MKLVIITIDNNIKLCYIKFSTIDLTKIKEVIEMKKRYLLFTGHVIFYFLMLYRLQAALWLYIYSFSTIVVIYILMDLEGVFDWKNI